MFSGDAGRQQTSQGRGDLGPSMPPEAAACPAACGWNEMRETEEGRTGTVIDDLAALQQRERPVGPRWSTEKTHGSTGEELVVDQGAVVGRVAPIVGGARAPGTDTGLANAVQDDQVALDHELIQSEAVGITLPHQSPWSDPRSGGGERDVGIEVPQDDHHRTRRPAEQEATEEIPELPYFIARGVVLGGVDEDEGHIEPVGANPDDPNPPDQNREDRDVGPERDLVGQHQAHSGRIAPGRGPEP
jgi:hypothetical protein